MNYIAFKEKIIETLKENFTEDTIISIEEIPQNNHINLDELTILEPGYTFSPSIYINEYFQQFNNGISFETICSNIKTRYIKHRPLMEIDSAFYTNYHQIKDRIVFKLIHYKQNEELLLDTPHVPYLDLAIVFYCFLSKSPVGSATILIRDHHLELWEIEQEELLKMASKNTPFLLPSQYMELEEIFNTLLNTDVTSQKIEPKKNAFPMYVLTNEMKLNGAACILYDNLLEDISNNLNSNLYILPCSIHEVLIVPINMDHYRHIFTPMVEEANKNDVPAEEILSDHVYFYDRKQKKLFI